MFGIKKGCFVLMLGAVSLLLGGCSVGTSSLFVHPKDQGYEYEVTYDATGGHINQMKTRVVYYADNSLLSQPNGTAGMLVEPKNGEKTLVGWYTDCEVSEDQNGRVYEFDEEDLWDFSNDRISSETATDKKIVLYARWADNPTIKFVDANSPDNVLLKWTINLGNKISKPTSTEPTLAGSTLIDYYSDPECTTKYSFGEVLTEDSVNYDEQGNAYIQIYCKFIEGEYTRIKTIAQLESIAKAPDAYYILADNMDLKGEDWTPIANFSGEFDGNGYAISNLTVNAKVKKSGIAAKKAEEESFGLFAKLDGAKIYNLTLKDTVVSIDSTSNVLLCAGALAGRTKNTTITNTVFDGVTITADGNCKIDLTVSPTVVGNASTRFDDCTIINYTEPRIKTTGTLTVVSGN